MSKLPQARLDFLCSRRSAEGRVRTSEMGQGLECAADEQQKGGVPLD